MQIYLKKMCLKPGVE